MVSQITLRVVASGQRFVASSSHFCAFADSNVLRPVAPAFGVCAAARGRGDDGEISSISVRDLGRGTFPPGRDNVPVGHYSGMKLL